jgi:transposase InsO family protein
MPFETRSAVDQRNLFITAWLKREQSLSALCRQFTISRKCGYKWIERFDEQGREGLWDQSRAPHYSPQAIGEAAAEKLLAERRLHPWWGARKILERLKRLHPDECWPAASSIGELLKREGLIQSRRGRRRTPPDTQPLAHAGEPNQVWCADFKGWFRYGDGMRCDPLTVTDACSRYLLCCRATDKADGPHVRAVMEAMFREYGLPQAMRSDNGPPFASRAPGGLSRLSMWWMKLGIRHERIDPGCPQQNGRHERMHKTMKQETATPPAANRRRQQEAFILFEREYNEQRPHEALQWRTPSDLYVVSPRPYPSRLAELEYPDGAHMRVISQQGSLKWKCERTFVSEVLGREMVGLLEVDDNYFEVYYGMLHIGWFDGRRHKFSVPQPKARKKKPAKTGT